MLEWSSELQFERRRYRIGKSERILIEALRCVWETNGVTASFLILVTGQFNCSLKQTGVPGIRIFSTPEEAMEEVLRLVPNGSAEVTISHLLSGATSRAVVEPNKPFRIPRPAVSAIACS